mmetsp:Transcript_2397/g.5732  ORF Transcript_2397/g.5732 Transcript_2397/m.5732 type:complete len:144 (-) Transcript_2397:535-966(-)
MIEITASAAAWIGVVVVQALLHYFVLGARREARRERIRKETEALIMEESLSYSEESVESDILAPNTPTGEPCISTISYLSSDPQQGNLKAIPSEPYSHHVSIELSETFVDRTTSFHLTQTGTEILKNCSLENIVEQQIRAIPQ